VFEIKKNLNKTEGLKKGEQKKLWPNSTSKKTRELIKGNKFCRQMNTDENDDDV
jgi:hypothetical protein